MVRILLLTLFLLAAWPAWVRGGTPPELQWPLPWLGGLILLLTLAGRVTGGPRCPALFRVLRDPFFYLGLLFLALLGLQWYYAGRFQFFDPVAREWVYTPPLRPGWPYAFSRPEAAEMLCWFFPAWAAALALRSWIIPPPRVRLFLSLLCINAAIIGLLGIVQQQWGLFHFPFTADLDIRFFASFGYENHAASFFALMAAVSIGIALRDLLIIRPRRHTVRGATMTIVFAVNLCAAVFSLSRSGIVLAILLLVAGLIWFFNYCWPAMNPGARINAITGGAAVMATVIMFTIALGGDKLVKEFDSLSQVGGETLESAHAGPVFGVRVRMFEAAFDILRESPLFGVGGWGYRYLLPYTLPDEDWSWSTEFGTANVHNDPVQFLVEFGIIGALLLTLGVITLLWPAFRRNSRGSRESWANPVVFFSLLGTALVLLHSMIDLPFRSPAILIAWTMTLAATATSASRQAAN